MQRSDSVAAPAQPRSNARTAVHHEAEQEQPASELIVLQDEGGNAACHEKHSCDLQQLQDHLLLPPVTNVSRGDNSALPISRGLAAGLVGCQGTDARLCELMTHAAEVRADLTTACDALGAIERVAKGTPAARIARVTLAALGLSVLAACGGGDCDADCLKDFDPVNCQARPELCK